MAQRAYTILPYLFLDCPLLWGKENIVWTEISRLMTNRGLGSLLNRRYASKFLCGKRVYAYMSKEQTYRRCEFVYVRPLPLSPWSRVLLEKPTVSQCLTKFPKFYGTQRFIIVFPRAHHWSLYRDGWIQSVPPVLILSYHLLHIFLVVTFLLIFARKPYLNSSSARATCLAHLIFLDLITVIIFCEDYKLGSYSLCSFLQSPITSFVPVLRNPQFILFPYCQRQKFIPTQHYRQDYGFVYCIFYVFRQQTRRQKVLNSMVVSFRWILSAAGFLMNQILIWYCNVYGWYASQIRGLLRRLIGFITTSVTLAHLITIRFSSTALSLMYTVYNSPLLTH
jgi:hypothetical protein